jgi:chromosomal replication initiator protein
MVKDYVQVWDSCLQTIKQRVPTQSYNTWFMPIRPMGLRDNALVIQVPNKFFYEMLEESYVDILKTAIRKELGDRAKLEYQILMHNGGHINGGQIKPKINGHAAPQSGFHAMDQEVDIKNPFVIPGIQRPKIASNLNAEYTFDTFVEGDCNRLARNAGIAITQKPGGTSFNPLVIFGNVGLGKTHLAHAIGNKVVENFSNKTALYVSCAEFGNQIINSIKTNKTNDLVVFYQLIDVLIVDDIQFLEGKQKTQEIFFNIFNKLHQEGKQIILTCDRPPKDLQDIEDRLISRFKWGLSADLGIPDFETRIAILESKMTKEGVDIPKNVVEFVCFNIKNNIRELEGALISIIAQSTLNNREVNMDLAKEVVKSFVREISKEITVEFIQELVANHFNVPADRLAGETRKRQVVIARQLSMYLAKKLTDQSLKAIGELFGGRDHSTVIYSCKTVQDLMETDAVYKDTVTELEKKIKMSLNEK